MSELLCTGTCPKALAWQHAFVLNLVLGRIYLLLHVGPFLKHLARLSGQLEHEGAGLDCSNTELCSAFVGTSKLTPNKRRSTWVSHTDSAETADSPGLR